MTHAAEVVLRVSTDKAEYARRDAITIIAEVINSTELPIYVVGGVISANWDEARRRLYVSLEETLAQEAATAFYELPELDYVEPGTRTELEAIIGFPLRRIVIGDGAPSIVVEEVDPLGKFQLVVTVGYGLTRLMQPVDMRGFRESLHAWQNVCMSQPVVLVRHK